MVFQPYSQFFQFVHKIASPIYDFLIANQRFQRLSKKYYASRSRMENSIQYKFINRTANQINDEFYYSLEAAQQSTYFRRIRKTAEYIFLGFMGGFLCNILFYHDNRFLFYMLNNNVEDHYKELTHVTNDKRYLMDQTLQKIFLENMERDGMDILGWIALGSHALRKGNMELGYSNFYMAHLLEPKLVKANSDLQFNLMEKKDDEKTTIDKILKSMQEEQPND